MQRESTNGIIHGKHDRQYIRNITFLKIVCCIVLCFVFIRTFFHLSSINCFSLFRVECKALWYYWACHVKQRNKTRDITQIQARCTSHWPIDSRHFHPAGYNISYHWDCTMLKYFCIVWGVTVGSLFIPFAPQSEVPLY
jgi:hypothetical protein